MIEITPLLIFVISFSTLSLGLIYQILRETTKQERKTEKILMELKYLYQKQSQNSRDLFKIYAKLCEFESRHVLQDQIEEQIIDTRLMGEVDEDSDLHETIDKQTIQDICTNSEQHQDND